MNGVGLIAATVALGLALALRIPAMDAEPWLDEILSLDMAHEAATPWGVWTLKHDNNHRLNSLWLQSCSRDASPVNFRLLALVAGVVAVILAASAWHWSAALLVACSWWPVMLSTEARGYSLAIAFALLAFLALQAYWEWRLTAALVVFWLASSLAFLSHLTFLHTYLGFVAWSAVRTRGDNQLKGLATIHALPCAFLGFYWFTALRGMHLEGGPPYATSEVMLSLVSRGLGGPATGWLAVPVALIGLALFVLGMAHLIREKADVWIFFAVAVLMPPLLVVVLPPPFLFERYFALPWVFFLLVIAVGWLDLLAPERPLTENKEEEREPPRPSALGAVKGWASLLLPLAFLVGSIWTAIDFQRHQRGRLREAIAWIAEQPVHPTVAGDDDFRIRTVLGYHDKERRLTFVPREALPPAGASWLLVHYQDASREVPETVEHGGIVYERAAGWPSLGPADWGWFVFRNTGRKAAP